MLSAALLVALVGDWRHSDLEKRAETAPHVAVTAGNVDAFKRQFVPISLLSPPAPKAIEPPKVKPKATHGKPESKPAPTTNPKPSPKPTVPPKAAAQPKASPKPKWWTASDHPGLEIYGSLDDQGKVGVTDWRVAGETQTWPGPFRTTDRKYHMQDASGQEWSDDSPANLVRYVRQRNTALRDPAYAPPIVAPQFAPHMPASGFFVQPGGF